MKVVRHQAPRQHAHGDFNASVAEGLQKGVVVTVLEENLPASVAAIEDVIAQVANRDSG